MVASFPGLPRFFCSSVSVDNNTRMRKGRPSASVLLSTETEEQKKRGRPGNEARNVVPLVKNQLSLLLDS